MNTRASHRSRSTAHGGTRDLPGTWADRLRRVAVPVVLVLLSFAMVFSHASVEQRALSPLDEWVYIDYLAKVPSQGVVRQGEEAGQYAKAEEACHGVRGFVEPDQALCEQVAQGTAPDSRFPQGGKTSADIYTPVYFAVTRVVAQGLMAMHVAPDLTVGGSEAGAVWLGAGMVFFFLALRRLRVPRLAILGLGTLLIASPAVYWSSTYVSTDAPALLVGAAMLWLGLRVAQGASGRVALVLTAIVGTLIKVQNISAVIIPVVVLVAWSFQQAWADRRPEDRRLRWVARGFLDGRFWTGVVTGVAAVGAQAAWVVTRAALSAGPSPDQQTDAVFDDVSFVGEMRKFLEGSAGDATNMLRTGQVELNETVLSWLAIAGVVGLVFAAGPRSLEAWLARSTLLTAVTIGPLLAWGVIAVTGAYFVLPIRYGMPMLPAFLACAAVLLAPRRWWTLGILALSIVSFASALG